MDSLEHLSKILKEKILQNGNPWSKYILLRDILKTSPNDETLLKIKQKLVHHRQVKSIYQKLFDPKLGIPSFADKPASHKVYGSFYWGLRFLADIGITSNEFSLNEIIHQLFIHQLPDGQFTTSYHRKNKTPVTAVCLTAHLAYSLAKLGFQNSTGVKAAVNYILTTQRKDGGWHCDWKKQMGERDEDARSCPSANINVIRALAMFGNRYNKIVETAVNQIYDHWKNPHTNGNLCDFGIGKISLKLRYPPHYWGYDMLNVLDTLSMFPQFCRHSIFEEMMHRLVSKWDGKNLFKSEKTIPEWKDFNFGRNNQYSCWISCLVCRILSRIQ